MLKKLLLRAVKQRARGGNTKGEEELGARSAHKLPAFWAAHLPRAERGVAVAVEEEVARLLAHHGRLLRPVACCCVRVGGVRGLSRGRAAGGAQGRGE